MFCRRTNSLFALQNYVHRSGRTARAMNEGLSVMFVSPDDLPNYRKIIKALNRGFCDADAVMCRASI